MKRLNQKVWSGSWLEEIDGIWYYNWREITETEAEQIDRKQVLSFEDILDIIWKVSEKVQWLIPESFTSWISALRLKRKIAKARKNIIRLAYDINAFKKFDTKLWRDIINTMSYCVKNWELNAKIDIQAEDWKYILIIQGCSNWRWELDEDWLREILVLY